MEGSKKTIQRNERDSYVKLCKKSTKQQKYKKKHRNKITKLLKSFKWKCVNMFILYMTRKCKIGFFNDILVIYSKIYVLALKLVK